MAIKSLRPGADKQLSQAFGSSTAGVVGVECDDEHAVSPRESLGDATVRQAGIATAR